MEQKRLETLYYTPDLPSSYGGARQLSRHGKQNPRTVRKWLRGQDAYTLHKQTNSKFQRRPTIVSGKGIQLQADLMDVSRHSGNNDRVKFLITAIDVFSRMAWAIPITSKHGPVVAKSLKKIFDDGEFKYFQTDKGKEFDNKEVKALLKQKNIKWFTSENETIKASLVERFNKTLRAKIHRFLTKTRGDRFIDSLNSFVKAYNNTYHTAIGMAPNDVNFNNQEDVWHRIYEQGEHGKQKAPMLKKG